MKFKVDRELQVPLGLQIKGLIEYGIACGELVVGEPLPSVRDLAEMVGVSPMTVSLVYRDLKKAGLIETRPGAGTRVADSSQARMAGQPAVVSLHRRIDELVDCALAMGIHTSDLGALINARLRYRLNAGHRISLVMVGLFPEATESYAKFVATQVGRGVTVEPMTVEEIQRIPEMRHRAGSADLALTFANTHREVSDLLPNTEVVSIRFIPSEATRLGLASLDPMARVAVVSRFPDFLPILKSGVQRFAAHVQNILAITLDDATLSEALRNANVVVYSTGAEQAREAALPGTQAIEYRHTPDPGDIERLVIPFVDKAMQTPDAAGQADGLSLLQKQA
jgi:DNA-binding transcriptional regulator YhcF (GntR family)